MTCTISKGRLELCKDSIGGIKKVFFINAGANVVVSSDIITDINDGAGTPGAISVYQYDTKDVSNFVETGTSSRETGTSFWEQVLSLTLKQMNSSTRKELKIMAFGSYRIVIMDNNNNLFMMGKDRGCDVTGGTIVTGTALGDLSGYTLTLTGREAQPANFLFTTATNPAATGYPFDKMTTVPTIVVGT